METEKKETGHPVISPPAVSKPRRAAAPGVSVPVPRASRNKSLLFMTIALIAGVGLGGVLERQRVHSKDIVAVVSGHIITKDQLIHRMLLASGDEVMLSLANDDLTLAYAKQLHLLPSEAEVHEAYQEATQNQLLSSQLKKEYPDEAMHDIKVQLARAMLISGGQTVSDAEMQAFYNDNINPHNPKAEFYHAESATIAIIVTPTRAAAYKAQQSLLAGLPFSIVAQTYSVDKSAANGGLLPEPITYGGAAEKIPGLLSFIFSLTIGQTSTPHEFNLHGTPSWWIVRMLDHNTTYVPPFSAVKEQCKIGVMLSRVTPAAKTALDKKFADWRKSQVVRDFWPEVFKALQSTGANVQGAGE